MDTYAALRIPPAACPEVPALCAHLLTVASFIKAKLVQWHSFVVCQMLLCGEERWVVLSWGWHCCLHPPACCGERAPAHCLQFQTVLVNALLLITLMMHSFRLKM